MADDKTKIIVQRKNPRKPHNWCNWDWLIGPELQQNEKVAINYGKNWIKKQSGDGETYRLVRRTTLYEEV
jgi:hypothetical protein